MKNYILSLIDQREGKVETLRSMMKKKKGKVDIEHHDSNIRQPEEGHKTVQRDTTHNPRKTNTTLKS